MAVVGAGALADAPVRVCAHAATVASPKAPAHAASGGFVPVAFAHAARPGAVASEYPQAGGIFTEAYDLGLRTLLGCPYAGMDVTVRFGELTALRGHNNSGETALLLTLAGRMAHTRGTFSILGRGMPEGRGKIQRKIGLGIIEEINDVPSSLTAAQAASAELTVFGKPSDRDAAIAFLRACDLENTARMNVADLPREKLVARGIALGMAGGRARWR